MKLSRHRILSITAAFLAIAALNPFAAATAHDNQAPAPAMQKTISVTGNASASYAPDLVNVQFGVETRKKSAGEALSENSRQMDQIIKAIRRLGLTGNEISTSRFNIQAVYESHRDSHTGNHTQVLIGYRVSNIVSVELK